MTNLTKKHFLAIGFGILTIVLFQNCTFKSDDKTNQPIPTDSQDNNSDPDKDSDSSKDPNQSETCFSSLGTNSEWGNEEEVEIDGYSGNAMEVKASADEVVLFWNDKPSVGDTAMNIHYAVRQSSGRYLYIGTLPGAIDSNFLDGVPAIDNVGNFYFVSTRSYSSNFQTIYGGAVNVLAANSLSISNVSLVDSHVTEGRSPYLDMDIDVSWDGTIMISSRAQFSGNPFPDSSKLVLFNLTSRVASHMANSDQVLENVNSSLCRVYAASMSADKKELYYTLIPKTTATMSDFRIVVAKRNSTSDAFSKGAVIKGISINQTEGPAISYDGKSLYFHKYDGVSGRFKLYKVSR